MESFNQPLAWIIAGTVLGIMITIGLRRRQYYGHYPAPRTGAGLATLMFFLFLIAVIAMAHTIREEEATSQSGEDTKNWVDELNEEAGASPGGLDWLKDRLKNVPPTNQEQFGQSPEMSKDASSTWEAGRQIDTIIQSDPYEATLRQKNRSRGSPPVPSEDGHGRQKDDGRIYIQALAGPNKDVAEREIHKYLDRFPGNTFLGVSEGALPYRVLIGPYLNKQDAVDAMRRLHLNGFPKDVVKDNIKVYPID